MVEAPPSCPTATLSKISGRKAAHADEPWPMSSRARSGSLARPASRRAVMVAVPQPGPPGWPCCGPITNCTRFLSSLTRMSSTLSSRIGPLQAR